MEYRLCAPDPSHYATGLRLQGELLRWEVSQGHDTLLFRMEYGRRPTRAMERYCRALSRLELRGGSFTKLEEGVAVRRVSFQEKSRNNGCPLAGRACTYTVFACLPEGECCLVYGHEEERQTMIVPYCSVPMKLGVQVVEEKRTQRTWFRREEVPTGFFRLLFPEEYDSGYHDGDLCYRLDGLLIPVTREMLRRGVVYVKSAQAPEPISGNPGLELE